MLITALASAKPVESGLHWWKVSAPVAARPWYRTPEALAGLSFAIMLTLNLIFW